MTTEAPAQALTAELRSFLNGTPPRHAALATVNRDGTPHQIVVWYRMAGDEVVVNSRHGRRWPSNLRRQQRAAIAVHDGNDAVMLTCELVRVYEGDEAQTDIAEMAHRYYRSSGTETSIARFRTERRISFVLRPTSIHTHGDPR